MDQINLNVGVPLLIQDPSETVVYMDNQNLVDDYGNLYRKNEETLKSEAHLINPNSIKDSIVNNDMIGGETLIINPVNSDGEILSMKTSNDVITEHLVENNNDRLVQGPEVYMNGQMVQLLDGTTAFVENPIAGKNEVYAPINMYNGGIIYVVAGNLVNNESCGLNSSESEEKTEEVTTSVVPETEPEPKPVPEPEPEHKQEKSKGFQCSYKNCNKSYSSFHHLKVHQRVHTGDRPFRCSVEGCNKAFSTGFGLKTHFRTHNGERPYTCNHENCEKGFKTSGDLQKHIRTHTGERPFVCPIPNCGRSFTTCNICKVHVRTHTGERPYKCTYPNCNKTFASVTNQRNHMRIHSGEKPYVCSVEKCGRRFTEYSSLYKHNMVHRQQPHLCLICGKTYRQASGLMMHMKSVHADHQTFVRVGINPTDAVTQTDDLMEDETLEDSLFTEFEEENSLNV